MKIELWDILEDGLLGVIVPLKTGVVWSNQTGGTCCAHPELEGIYVPLKPWDDALTDVDPFYDRWGQPYSPALVLAFLSNFGLDQWLEPTQPPEHEANGEAWVWAKVRTITTDEWLLPEILRPLSGMLCVVTYPNSD
jgi:hypothetical protein